MTVCLECSDSYDLSTRWIKPKIWFTFTLLKCDIIDNTKLTSSCYSMFRDDIIFYLLIVKVLNVTACKGMFKALKMRNKMGFLSVCLPESLLMLQRKCCLCCFPLTDCERNLSTNMEMCRSSCVMHRISLSKGSPVLLED